jgi:hypothetical protein
VSNHFFTYHIFCPEDGSFYYGSASNKYRYSGAVLGQEIPEFYTHHNKRVQQLIDYGFKLCWEIDKEFETHFEALKFEDSQLKAWWPSGSFQDRPIWLLNESNNSRGFSCGEANRGSFEARSRGGSSARDLKKGMFSASVEQRLIWTREAAAKAGELNRINKTGVCGIDKEILKAIGKKNGNQNSEKWAKDPTSHPMYNERTAFAWSLKAEIIQLRKENKWGATKIAKFFQIEDRIWVVEEIIYIKKDIPNYAK